jgi:hypothetical protein
MNAYLVLLGLLGVMFLINVILTYRNRLQQQQHKAEITKTILQAVTETAEHRRRLDDDLMIVEDKHRVETIAQQAHLAARADFDNDWDGLPNHPSGAAADRSAAAAGQTGITRD